MSSKLQTHLIYEQLSVDLSDDRITIMDLIEIAAVMWIEELDLARDVVLT